MTTTPPTSVLHIPHASIVIDEATRATFRLDDEALAEELLQMTDWCTDELFMLDSAVAAAVVFPVSRLVLDPERFTDDAKEPMAARGMGVVYTRTSQCTPLRKPIDAGERERLLARYYRPHHEALTGAVDAALAAWDTCFVLDCHSFPSTAQPSALQQYTAGADICLGTDAFHTPPRLVDAARAMFEGAGFTVAIDYPYSGALVPAAHYQRDRRVSALMVEINRALYMDERTGARLCTFASVRERLQGVVRELVTVSG